MTSSDFTDILRDKFPGKFRVHVLLAPYTTFKIGGPAQYFLEAGSPEDIVSAVGLARTAGVPVFILGGGSNILVCDGGFDGLVIKNNARSFGVAGIKGTAGKSDRKDVFITVQSGAIMNQIVRYTIDEGLSGLHMHLGLPGTVGGAVAMNSKWMHPEGSVGDVVYQATILTRSGDVRVVSREYFHFAYGSSSIPGTGDIVLEVIFKLIQSDREALWKTATESIEYRRKTQPQGAFCAGCIFKNISRADAITHSIPDQTTSAGFLIDHSGMKEAEVGSAYISPVHANFIINKDHATADDVLKLIMRTRESVRRVFRIELQEEILTVGKN